MRTIKYELDEFRPWPDLSVFVYGVATINYNEDPADAYSGWPGGFVFEELESLEIHAHLTDKMYIIEPDHPLFKAIETALCLSDHVITAFEEDWGKR